MSDVNLALKLIVVWISSNNLFFICRSRNTVGLLRFLLYGNACIYENVFKIDRMKRDLNNLFTSLHFHVEFSCNEVMHKLFSLCIKWLNLSFHFKTCKPKIRKVVMNHFMGYVSHKDWISSYINAYSLNLHLGNWDTFQRIHN